MDPESKKVVPLFLNRAIPRRAEVGLELVAEGERDGGIDFDAAFHIFEPFDLGGAVQEGEQVVAVRRQEQFQVAPGMGELGGQPFLQAVEAIAGAGGNEDGVWMFPPDAVEFQGVGNPVALVEDGDGRKQVGLNLAQNLAGGDMVRFDGRAGGVQDFNEKVGFGDFFQGGLERFDQLVRQFADEADGVGEQQVLASGQAEAADGGVQRGEELVLDQDARVGQGVEQAGFAGIR